MAHPVPKALKGEERILQLKFMDLYLTKMGLVYNGIACLIAGIVAKLSGNLIVFLVVFLILNGIAYPLGQCTTRKNNFDGGNIRYDKYLLIKWKYRRNKNVYLRQKTGYKKGAL